MKYKSVVVTRRGGPEVLQVVENDLLLVAKLLLYNVSPNGKRIKGYGTHRGDIGQYKDDWTELFRLLEEGKIKPVIAAKFPILEARKANELLASGQVIGNVVLLSPELL